MQRTNRDSHLTITTPSWHLYTTATENLGKKSERSCFNYGVSTHLIKGCNYSKKPGKDKEAHRSESAVAVITQENETT